MGHDERRTDMDRRQALAFGGLGLLAAGGRGALASSVSPGRSARGVGRIVRVTQGTNIALATSPNGAKVAMDLLGILWTVPVKGGRAVRLTGLFDDLGQPDWSPDGSRIIFQSYRTGNFHIWSVAAAGGALTQLTDGFCDDREPRWSPDGKSIAFSSDRADGRYAIYLLDVARGTITPLSHGTSQDSEPCWSADGAQIAYVADGNRILVTTIAGGAPVVAVSVPPSTNPLRPSEIHAPAFGPDGKLWFTTVIGGEVTLRRADTDIVAGADLYPFRPAFLPGGALLYAADGEIRRRHDGISTTIDFSADVPVTIPKYAKKRRDFTSNTRHPVRGIVGPQLSPDGRRIVFCALNDIYVMEIGRAPRKLVQGPFAKCDPAWSPDGKWIAYSTDKGGTLDLWLVETATGAERQLTNLPNQGLVYAAWSPDGSLVACIDQEGALHTVDVAKGIVQKVFTALWEPGRPSFGPDGKTIAYAAFKPVSARFREGASEVLTVNRTTGKAAYQAIAPGKSIGVRGLDGPVWSPDGTSMAYVFASTLWVVPVTASGTFSGPARQITFELTDAPSWSGDSRSILYLSGGVLKIVPAAGGVAKMVPCPLVWANAVPAGRKLIAADRLWDGRSQDYTSDKDVVLHGNQIEAVVPKGSVTDASVEKVDGSGLTLMPGLVDIHTHRQMSGYNYGDRMGRIWLSMGITATRSPGAPAYHMVEDREAIDSGARIAPRHYATGEAIDGGRIFYNFMRPVTEPGQMERELERARVLSYDLVKTYVRLRHDHQKQVIDAAHAMGMHVSSHYHYPALQSGIDGMEHMGATNRYGYSRTATALGGGYQDVNRLFGEAAAARTPTLAVANALLSEDDSIARDPRVKLLFPPWEYAKVMAHVRLVQGAMGEMLLASLQRQVRQIKDMMAEGGVILSGTDAPIDLVAISLHLNLRGMTRNGIQPVDALMTATSNAGAFMNEPLGRIAPGMLGDLILVDGDPLAKIDDAAAVRMVIANGVVHTPESLMAPFARSLSSNIGNEVLPPLPIQHEPFWHSASYVETARGACCADHWHSGGVHHA